MDSVLSAREKMFAEIFARTGDLPGAARQAGYKSKNLELFAHRLCQKAKVAAYIEELRRDAANLAEVLDTVTEILRDKEQRAADRLKAAEIKARALNLFEVKGGVSIVFGWEGDG